MTELNTAKPLKTISKFLSFVLRHKPDAIGLALDNNGWANIEQLIKLANQSDESLAITHELIVEIVKTNDKKRFIISDDGLLIRANQGHSIKVDLELTEQTPPELLYHGTASRFLESIFIEGLKPKSRHHVHLSTDIETANSVGQRYGKPVILSIKAREMHNQGFKFYCSENGVWLTDTVPVKFITKD
ncbi:RNA 2'-phosphotransferase [Pleionea sediminis]|uniref:RNA 2'-phosphotransferase n=1 Tax=Pleionea sediminis TaxID=2569479 RepID=UPI0011865ABE|nr:RNA 2'-phosphotransferase [Pleionea sediminis]